MAPLSCGSGPSLQTSRVYRTAGAGGRIGARRMGRVKLDRGRRGVSSGSILDALDSVPGIPAVDHAAGARCMDASGSTGEEP